ncbi:hypothetical protein [Lentzea jiangxiensis]|uniref:hypothetical protein n=1 Tax=Lentzea jiangxiensis TaxID=641025 RepID=UPI0015A0BA38|nr:hypothetical protein [Lentzea jiangxiensis]
MKCNRERDSPPKYPEQFRKDSVELARSSDRPLRRSLSGDPKSVRRSREERPVTGRQLGDRHYPVAFPGA